MSRLKAIKTVSVLVGAALIAVGIAGFLQVNTSVVNATEINGAMMSTGFGLYFFASLALIVYGALAGRKPRLP
ncbi:MAG: hypothetical protein OK449_03960 [Thaumarchaeota archaeon]|nr:hypothetical protein [Nitrososphaerota archaeon]